LAELPPLLKPAIRPTTEAAVVFRLPESSVLEDICELAAPGAVGCGVAAATGSEPPV